MFAIELTQDNLGKILSASDLTLEEFGRLLDIFYNREYMFISGYTNEKNRLENWAIMPLFVFKDTFDYDPDKIKTEWDIIVRKPAA